MWWHPEVEAAQPQLCRLQTQDHQSRRRGVSHRRHGNCIHYAPINAKHHNTSVQLARRRPGHTCISGGFLMCAVFVSVMCGAIMKVTRRQLALATFRVATFGNIICAKVWFVRPVPEQTGDFDNVRLDISLIKCEFSSVPLLRFSRSICPDSRHYCPQMSLSLKCRRSRGRALTLLHKQSHCFCSSCVNPVKNLSSLYFTPKT